MINKILVVGFACLSLAAFAQSDNNKKKDTEAVTTASPRDTVSGQATGKRQHKPLRVTAEEEGANAATCHKQRHDVFRESAEHLGDLVSAVAL